MLRYVLLSLVLGGAGVVAVACGDGETQETLCEPGTEVFCKCRGGYEGTKTCSEDGQTFGECTTAEGACPEIPDTTSSSSDSQLCTPGEEVFCTCDNGDDGSKVCSDDGQSYGDCTTAEGACGAGSGDKLLYEPCTDGSECQTGTCDSGYCTRECASFQECGDDANMIYGDCVALDGGAKQLCAPYCLAQSDCTAYGPEVQCGGATALDDPTLGFAACAAWGDAVAGYPAGTLCDEVEGTVLVLGEYVVDGSCSLGLEGVQNVCLFSECAKGCYEATDCPMLDCTSDGSVPGCCESEPDCN